MPALGHGGTEQNVPGVSWMSQDSTQSGHSGEALGTELSLRLSIGPRLAFLGISRG